MLNRRFDWTRRAWLGAVAAARGARAQTIPVRAITQGPGFHWFGYYDKLQFDPTSRFALGCRGTFEHRLPTADDTLEIGVVDTEGGDRWQSLGVTHAWSWHQTCMLQWLPGSRSEVIWNDRVEGKLVSHITDVRSGKRRTLPGPIYCLSPDARYGLTTDFRRLYDVRPETGYAGVADPRRDVAAPSDTGIWRMALDGSQPKLILSYAAALEQPLTQGGTWEKAKHWFNHLLLSPKGRRFVFLHRWRGPAEGTRFATRMFSANPDGTGLRVLDPYGKTSHFHWRDDRTLIVWADRPEAGEGWYLIHEPTGEAQPFARREMPRNGHISYFHGGRWIVCDTGPDRERKQTVFVYNVEQRRVHEIGRFYSAPEYTGYWRCDTTPRISPDGRKVVFDSPHGGNGRQMYLAEVGAVTG